MRKSYLNDPEKLREETERVQKLYDFDIKNSACVLAAGVDEVGRGPLAGPIVAAAVVLDLKSSNLILGINDSKKLSKKRREELSDKIKESALEYNIAEIDNTYIDKMGISWCNNEVFKKAVLGLKRIPDLVLVDGYPIKNFNIENKYFIKGDTKSASISCASIIAKVYRDKLMEKYSSIYKEYGFEKNAGYGTRQHIEAIKKCGPTKIHRMSFLKKILSL